MLKTQANGASLGRWALGCDPAQSLLFKALDSGAVHRGRGEKFGHGSRPVTNDSSVFVMRREKAHQTVQGESVGSIRLGPLDEGLSMSNLGPLWPVSNCQKL